MTRGADAGTGGEGFEAARGADEMHGMVESRSRRPADPKSTKDEARNCSEEAAQSSSYSTSLSSSDLECADLALSLSSPILFAPAVFVALTAVSVS